MIHSFPTPSSCKDSGFTLLEFSIALVIIGLVIGGVLIGQDLMRASEVRAQASQIEKMDVTVNAFRLKYGCLPGDCSTASQTGLGTNGNGNGKVDSQLNTMFTTTEGRGFWQHLYNSEMLEGVYIQGTLPGVHSPKLKMSPSRTLNGNAGLWINHYDFTTGMGFDPNIVYNGYDLFVANSWFLTASTQYANVQGIYLPQQAYMLDTKMDDGIAGQGRVQAQGHSIYAGGVEVEICNQLGVCMSSVVAPTSFDYNGSNGCADATTLPSQYNVQLTNPTPDASCIVLIKTTW